MKTYDIFNFRRFGKYFSSDIRTCATNYGLSLMTISIIFPIATYIITTAFNLLLQSTWDGPDMGLRAFVFIIAVFCMVVTMPVKCYGRITEKQYGGFWLTLPASKLEKFVSMILMTCIIAPLTGMALYLGMDAVICAIDHTCGGNLIGGAVELVRKMGELNEVTMNFLNEQITVEDAALAQELMRQISEPWIYIDEIFGITLPFLLGAIFFKNGKTAKTIITIFAISTLISIIMSPFLTSWAMEITQQANSDPNAILQMFSNGIFKNLILIDTLSDAFVEVTLMLGIWFRIKTLKH